jgi:hypothetical protein
MLGVAIVTRDCRAASHEIAWQIHWRPGFEPSGAGTTEHDAYSICFVV